jgi:WD40-like Beta Propeller Repeat
LTRSFSGANEVWICDFDGSNLLKLTSRDGPAAGSPRWSPDGQWIAFDVDSAVHGKVFVVSVHGGPVREIAPDSASQHLVPNWSRDGKWIYFASDRSGEWQVWKVPFSDGEPVQVTHQGGFAAAESALYYSKHRYPNPEVWRIASGENSEEAVSPLVRPMTWADWSVTTEGIYFVSREEEGRPVLQYFDFRSGGIGTVAELANPSFFVSISADVRLVVCAGKNWRN